MSEPNLVSIQAVNVGIFSTIVPNEKPKVVNADGAKINIKEIIKLIRTHESLGTVQDHKNSAVIHAITAMIFQSAKERQTDTAIPRATLLAWS